MTEETLKKATKIMGRIKEIECEIKDAEKSFTFVIMGVSQNERCKKMNESFRSLYLNKLKVDLESLKRLFRAL